MMNAHPNHTEDVDLDVCIDNAVAYQRIMNDARGQFEQAAADYRGMVAIALKEGVPAQELADALGIARSSVYDAARRSPH